MSNPTDTLTTERRADRKRELEKQEYRERSELLKDHHAKWRAARKALQDECEAEGHMDGDQPGDTSSCPWICWHCGAKIARRPYYADALAIW